jgi:dTDP-4-dehydrorhamnose 3,5-epimerase
MRLQPLAIPEVVEIVPKRHEDARGHFSEIFRADWFAREVADVEFVQDNQSLSRMPGTVRGLHFQREPMAQGKLIRCIAGALFDVAVDIRPGSPTYGKWVSEIVTAEDGNQLWIPAGFAHGFCSLVPDTVISYRTTAYYSAAHDAGIAWNDPDIGVVWPEIASPELLSAKDRELPWLAHLSRAAPTKRAAG